MSGLKKDMGAIQKAIQMLAGTYNQDILTFELATVTAVDTSNWQCTATLVSGEKPTEYKNIQLTSEIASNGFVLLPKVGSNVILAITWRNEIYVFMCSEVDALVFHQANNDNNKTFEEFVICNNPDSSLNLPLGIQLTDGGGNGIVINSGTAKTLANSKGDNGLIISSGTGNVTNASNGIVITNNDSPPSNTSDGILISGKGGIIITNSSNPGDSGGGVLITSSGTMKLNDGSLGGLTKTPELQKQLNKTNDLLNAMIKIINGTVITEAGNGATSALQKALSGAISSLQLGDYSQIENTDITHGPKVS